MYQRTPPPPRERIGTWHQRQEIEAEYLGEYAGHNETWRVHIGDTPILRCQGHPGSRRWVTASRPATRIRFYFYNRIGAHGSASIDNEPHPGTHAVQMDAFELARAVDRGDATLAEGYKVVTIGEYSSGEPMRWVVREDGRPFDSPSNPQ